MEKYLVDCKAIPWRAVIFSLLGAWLAVLVIHPLRILGFGDRKQPHLKWCIK